MVTSYIGKRIILLREVYMSIRNSYVGEKLIRKLQKDKGLYIEYTNVAHNLKNNILEFSQMHSKYFTSHGLLHIENVIDQLNVMIPDAILKEMNPLEIFILLCSAWLHDIGMLINKDGKGRILSDHEIRDTHHELARDFICKKHSKLGLYDPNIARIIADVCYCHRKVVDIQKYLPNDIEMVGTFKVRVRLLAAILRLADAMDVTSKRSPEIIFKDIVYLPELSVRHWRACQLIQGIGYNKERLAIIIDATYRNADEYELLLWKFRDLYQEFHSIRDILILNGLNYASLIMKLFDLQRRTVISLDGVQFFGTPTFPSWKDLRKSAEKRLSISLRRSSENEI